MEFIIISEDKIKVTLTAEDLEEFELDSSTLDYANTETKRMFWDVLSRAKHRTGFDTDGQKVLVQLYPSKQGGCEIFVTKIGSMYSDEEDIGEAPRAVLAETLSAKRRKKSAPSEKTKSFVYSFFTLEDMISACRELSRRGYNDDSFAYITDNSLFYLVLTSKKASVFQDPYRFLTEFGAEESAAVAKHFLREHADIIEKDAVNILGIC